MSLVKDSKFQVKEGTNSNLITGEKPLVSLLLSAFNEGSILEKNLSRLTEYLEEQEGQYDWEIILVNDGSSDNTGALAEFISKENSKVKVFHHRKNQGLGKGLQTGINNSCGKYVVTLDIDLSTSPESISRMLKAMIDTDAKVVTGSPTLKGGKLEGMPWHRKLLSIGANKFLSFFAPGKLSNLTCMARAYDGDFIRSLNLRSMGMEIMPEIIYKTMIMHERIVEIPIDLVWEEGSNKAGGRQSSMRIFRHTLSTLFTGFLLRPFLFFILPGFLLFLFSLYPITWMFIHFFSSYVEAAGPTLLERSSRALEAAYQLHPHTFFVAFFSLLLSIQLIAFGFHSLQNKHYFEEIFDLLTKVKTRKK